MSIKTCAPKGALAARQRIEEDPEALRISKLSDPKDK